MSLTERQRSAIRDRDENKCQFPCCPLRANGNSADVTCTPKRLNVHHIIPQRYAKNFGIEADYPENLLTVCEGAHTKSPESIHPDMAQALKDYGLDKESIKKVFVERNRKIENREVYWNTKYDRQMSVQAVRNTQLKQKQGWEFPHDIYRAKK